MSIALKKDVKLLLPITITPDDDALNLVGAAIRNIKNNYPLTKYQLEGFLRIKKKRADSLAYLHESVLLIEKESYTKKTYKGKVKLIKGRAVEAFELKTQFYGGHHLAHFADLVHSRSSYINISKTKDFHYEILDSLIDGENTFIRVWFESKKTTPRGELWINLEDLAFVKISVQENECRNNSILGLTKSGQHLYHKYNVEYKKTDSLWHLNFIEYKSAMSTENKKDTLSWIDIFTTTSIRDSIEEITYDEQFQYQDVTLRNMGAYDADFWQNYTIVLPSKEEEMLFLKYDPTALLAKIEGEEKAVSKQKNTLEQLSRVKNSFGLFMQPAYLENVTVNYTNGSFGISETVPSSSFFYTGLSGTLEYYFSNSFFIGYDIKLSFTNNKYSAVSLKPGYNKTLHAFGRPLNTSLAINLGYYRLYYLVGDYTIPESLEINNKTMDSGEVQLSLNSRRWSVEPTIRFSLEMNHRLSLFVEGGFNMPFYKTDGLHFKEKGQPFWKTKQTFLPLSHEDVSLTNEHGELNTIPLKTNVMVTLGILIHFKY